MTSIKSDTKPITDFGEKKSYAVVCSNISTNTYTFMLSVSGISLCIAGHFLGAS